MERVESSETSALKAQTPGDYPEKKQYGNTRVTIYPSQERRAFPIRKDDISSEKDTKREDI